MSLQNTGEMDQNQLILQWNKEHSIIREILLELNSALILEDIEQCKCLLAKLDEIVGPHFRYEEEAIYPAMVDVYCPGYINKLYTDHDLTIARINQLKNLFNQDNFTEMDLTSAIRHVRMISHYITNCETLPINNVKFDEQLIMQIFNTHKKSLDENLSLISWSDTIRNRKQLFFN